MIRSGIMDGDRYQWLLRNTAASSHLFSLLTEGKSSKAALAVFTDRIISIEAELEDLVRSKTTSL